MPTDTGDATIRTNEGVDLGNCPDTGSVQLDFAEVYWSAANQRLFNVSINGSQVLSNFDIYTSAGGKNKAMAKTFIATADSNGQITISFAGVKANAKVSGIELTRIG